MFDALVATGESGGTTAASSVTDVIAARVRALRQAQRLSGAALAERLNAYGIDWNRTTVAKLETGRRESLTVAELLALALVLGVPPVLLIADPRSDALIPVAEGVTSNPWRALWWLTGWTTLGPEEGTPTQPDAAALVRKIREVATTVRDIVDAETLARRQRPREPLDTLSAGLVRSLETALTDLIALGVATLPTLPPEVLDVAERAAVKLPELGG